MDIIVLKHCPEYVGNITVIVEPNYDLDYYICFCTYVLGESLFSISPISQELNSRVDWAL